jgi:hypothetical protein
MSRSSTIRNHPDLLRQVSLLMRGAKSQPQKQPTTPDNLSPHLRRDIGVEGQPAGRGFDAGASPGWKGRQR